MVMSLLPRAGTRRTGIYGYGCVPSGGGQQGATAGYRDLPGVRYGLSRGVFSNEAGLGTLAVLHGTTGDTTPQEQGMWAMFEVFFDTILSCTLTALAILCTLRRSAGRRHSWTAGR